MVTGKFVLQILLAPLLISSFTQVASASATAECKVKTNDIGTIVGKGRSLSAAFEDAATKCFDRRSDLYKMKKGKGVDEETGLVMIDMCANIKCDS